MERVNAAGMVPAGKFSKFYQVMLRLLEDLPVELVGTNVLGYLSVKDIVMLERACGSKKSHQAFIKQITYCAPVDLSDNKHSNISALNWFSKRQCRIHSLTIQLPYDIPGIYINNIKVDYLDLVIKPNTTIESLKPLLESNMGYKVGIIHIMRKQNKEFMEQLSVCTGNVKKLTINYSFNCMDWFVIDVISRWKLKEVDFTSCQITTHFMCLLVETCSELTSIKLFYCTVDDSAGIAIAQHCPKLETLLLRSSNITWTSLLALSELGLPLKELDIDYIPNIPTADIARRCSHALSCIRHLQTFNLHQNGQDANILLPYMTGLTSVELNYYCHSYIPLLTHHCHKLTKIYVYDCDCKFDDILSLCRVNPLLQEIYCHYKCYFTDTALIELIHVCPHLHTLYLPNETDITDIGILALSEHCPQLQWLNIRICKPVTETAVVQLLQRCQKLTKLYMSSSSLSEETWTQLDKNIQKRVVRCK